MPWNVLACFTFIFTLTAKAACPDWMNEAPHCAKSGSTLVSDNYPAIAQIISEKPYRTSPSNENFVVDLAEKILKSSGDRVPFLVVGASDAKMSKIRERIEKIAKDDSVQLVRERHNDAGSNRDQPQRGGQSLSENLPFDCRLSRIQKETSARSETKSSARRAQERPMELAFEPCVRGHWGPSARGGVQRGGAAERRPMESSPRPSSTIRT